MGSNVRGSQTLKRQAEIVQLDDGCMYFLCTNRGGGGPFVNSGVRKGCVCIGFFAVWEGGFTCVYVC